MNKPTFSTKTTSDTTSEVLKTPLEGSTINSNFPQRVEIGVSWLRTSKTNLDYMTAKLTFTKEELEELLKTQSSEGKVVVDLVAFKNKYYNDDPKRPYWRFYKDSGRNK